MTKKELELENARLRGENEALRTQNAMLVEAMRLRQDIWPYITTTPGFDWTAPSTCMHDNCPTCHGTGQGPGGPCIHMMSCPCPKCSPSYMTVSGDTGAKHSPLP